MRADRARRGAHRTRRRQPLLLMLCVMLAVGSGTLAACGQGTQRMAHAYGAPFVSPTAPALVSPVPLDNQLAARNAALGCAPRPPAPQPRVVYSGWMPGSGGSAPREVALTFDDGPTPYTSPPILAFLERTHTPATFFVEGQYVRQWPYLVRREWQDGFAIAVHTWDHPLMSQQTVPQMLHQFGDTLSAIHSAIGPSACVWLWRPPYADYDRQVLAVAASFGLTTVTWDDSSEDWTRPGAQRIASMVLAAAHPGAIILMHDGPALRDQTAAALPYILAGLKARGLTPVTLPKLLADGHYPGVSVTPGPPVAPPPSGGGATTADAARMKVS